MWFKRILFQNYNDNTNIHDMHTKDRSSSICSVSEEQQGM